MSISTLYTLLIYLKVVLYLDAAVCMCACMCERVYTQAAALILNLSIDTPYTRTIGVADTVCELQLLLASFLPSPKVLTPLCIIG